MKLRKFSRKIGLYEKSIIYMKVEGFFHYSNRRGGGIAKTFQKIYFKETKPIHIIIYTILCSWHNAHIFIY